MNIEKNIKASFRDVKLDIISVKTQILKLAEEQKELRDMVLELNEHFIKDKIKKIKKKSFGEKEVKKKKDLKKSTKKKSVKKKNSKKK